MEWKFNFLSRQGLQPELAGRVRVHVTDNVPVAKVLVKISNEQGEAASAINDPRREFETVTLREAKIIVAAIDLAGNCTRHEAHSCEK